MKKVFLIFFALIVMSLMPSQVRAETIESSGNGAGSQNSVNVNQTNTTTTNQDNTANVNNNVNANCNTGGNSSTGNSGNSTTTTGNCATSVNINNNVNNNQVGPSVGGVSPSPIPVSGNTGGSNGGGGNGGGSSSSSGGGGSSNPQVLGSTGVWNNIAILLVGFGSLFFGLVKSQTLFKKES